MGSHVMMHNLQLCREKFFGRMAQEPPDPCGPPALQGLHGWSLPPCLNEDDEGNNRE